MNLFPSWKQDKPTTFPSLFCNFEVILLIGNPSIMIIKLSDRVELSACPFSYPKPLLFLIGVRTEVKDVAVKDDTWRRFKRRRALQTKMCHAFETGRTIEREKQLQNSAPTVFDSWPYSVVQFHNLLDLLSKISPLQLLTLLYLSSTLLRRLFTKHKLIRDVHVH